MIGRLTYAYMIFAGLAIVCGCHETKPTSTNVRSAATAPPPASPSTQKATLKEERPPRSPVRIESPRSVYTADYNPTVSAGRGAPSLDDPYRPAAWVLIDGREGRFVNPQGRPQVQWTIDGSVRPEPTFRVEALPGMLGAARSFQGVLQSYQPADGAGVIYSIKAEEGSFELGREYSLLAPGPDFVIVDRHSNATVAEIPPLPPGTYGLAVEIRNNEADKEALAVSYFTVADHR